MRDSYKIFFEHFGIQFEEVIRFGVEVDTVYPEPDKIQKVWKDLIDAVVNSKPVWIRGYGKDSHGTELYLELYRILLGNNKIKKDSTNNAKPTSVLQKVTGFTKTPNDLQTNGIINYQVAHIWGRTKNPFLFSAPWNIVWKPKVLDPFTGHEAGGEFTEAYHMAFLTRSRELYSEFITEYNELADYYFSTDRVQAALREMETRHADSRIFNKFKADVPTELGRILVHP